MPLEINMKIIKKFSSSKGYTLLFAVIVSVLVLSIASFILSVSRKQAILSSSARDSVYAFYAADSGLECAAEHLDVLATSSAPSIITCGNSALPIVVTNTNNGDPINSAGVATFSVFTGTGSFNSTQNDPSTQSGAASCASTSISYVVTGGASTSTVITVITRGFNIGWDNLK